MLFGMFSCLGRRKKVNSKATPDHDRRRQQLKHSTIATKSSSVVILPPEIRQHFLFYPVSDKDLLLRLPVAMQLRHQDKKCAGTYKRLKQINLNFRKREMKELVFPNMSGVHPVLADDMQWVKKEWITWAGILMLRDGKSCCEDFLSFDRFVLTSALALFQIDWFSIQLSRVRPAHKGIGERGLFRLGRRRRVKGHYITFAEVGKSQRYTIRAYCRTGMSPIYVSSFRADYDSLVGVKAGVCIFQTGAEDCSQLLHQSTARRGDTSCLWKIRLEA